MTNQSPLGDSTRPVGRWNLGMLLMQGAFLTSCALLVVTPLGFWICTLHYGKAFLPAVTNGLPQGTATPKPGMEIVARVFHDVETTILLAVLALTGFATRRLYPVLWSLGHARLSNQVVMLALAFVFWIVFGGLSSAGMPGLFWNPEPWAQFMAGLGVTLFLYWMLYLLFVRDYEDHRHEPASQIWSRFRPALEQSGLPSMLGVDLADYGPRGQLGWFLAYAGLPALVGLTMPAVLPSLRSGDLARVVAWQWLLGMAVAVGLIALIIRTRAATRIHELWRQLIERRLDFQQLRDLAPDRLDPHANAKNILVIVTLLFVVSYLFASRPREFFPPAFSFCVVLGTAATFAVWLGMKGWRTRLLTGLVILGLVATSGILDYEVVIRELNGEKVGDSSEPQQIYPTVYQQLLRRLAGIDAKPKVYGRVKDLATIQQSMPIASEQPEDQKKREEFLGQWEQTLRRTSTSTRPDGKPILVVVTTSGGALRAAIWTETVLRTLDEEFPGFHRHVRLMTGASGGMLGAACYVVKHRDSKRPASAVIDSDYLTPIAWQIAFRDFFPFSLWPFPCYNRGDVLEDAWADHAPGLNLTFDSLRPEEEQGEIPSIIFSPMLVEDGRRLLISNLPLADLTRNAGTPLLDGDKDTLRERYMRDQLRQQKVLRTSPQPPTDYNLEYPGLSSVSAAEFFSLLGPKAEAETVRKSLRLASAVRMSATFPYVTSVVTLPTFPPRHVVDAGYYDNYGVNLAATWLTSHAPWLSEHVAGLLVVQIRAFRNEKRLKILDQEIRSLPGPGASAKSANFLRDTIAAAVRLVPLMSKLVAEGLQSFVIPAEGVAMARESSMFFRNDENLQWLHHIFTSITDDERFFRTVIFTCDTLQVGQTTQNVETLNWYIDPVERLQIQENMRPLDPDSQVGRDRNDLRLQDLKSWWNERGGKTSK